MHKRTWDSPWPVTTAWLTESQETQKQVSYTGIKQIDTLQWHVVSESVFDLGSNFRLG